ncbi:MAG: MarR family transcriptional regulator [Gammaproteobacteria bacterium]|nr:MarR family transcriptional regulator [Gammaproteobacteria bacterium]
MPFKLDEHTGVLIKKAARLFERVANMNLDELGVTYAQTIFLVRLWEKDGQTQNQLTQSAGLKQPTVVRTLDRMERDKLIKRVRNKEDKRSYHFYLTERAKQACKKLEGQGKTMQEISTGNFNDRDIKKLNQQLLTVINNLQTFITKHDGEI